MYWEVIDKEHSSIQEYRLIENNDCKVVLKYNSLQHSARITSGNNHRLFYLENSGALKGKTIFKNEYGMEIGKLVHDKFHAKEGTLVIDSKKFLYQEQNNPSAQLVIYENDLQKPVASCSIPTSKNILQNVFSTRTTPVVGNNCYLLGLCWYLFLPLVR